MGNLPLGKNQLKSSNMGPQLSSASGLALVKRLVNDPLLFRIGMEPDSLESLTSELRSLTTAGKNIIESKVKEETGFTLQEARFHTLEGYNMLEKYKQTKDGELKKKIGYWLTRSTAKYNDNIHEMSDELYNAFFQEQLWQVFDQAKNIENISKGMGSKVIDELHDEVSTILEFFKKGTTLESPERAKVYGLDIKPEETKSANDISGTSVVYDASWNPQFNRTDLEVVASDLLQEMSKSKKTEYGEEEYVNRKMTVPSSDMAIDIANAVVAVTGAMKPLIDNYWANKDALRGIADEELNTMVDDNIERNKIPIEEIPSKDLGQQVMDPVKDPESYDKEDFDPLNDPETVIFNPEGEKSFVSDEDIIYSELDRVYNALDKAQRVCQLNLKFPLISLSTHNNGGRVKNLRHSGNTRYEMIDAIEELNGRQRL